MSFQKFQILWRILSWVIVLSGSVYQLFTITGLYRRYETINDVTFTRDYPSAPPIIAVCGSPTAFLDRHHEKYQLALQSRDPLALLNASIDAKIAARSIMYRKFGYQMKGCFGDIKKYLNMDIFYKHNRMCYSFALKPSAKIDMANLHTALYGYVAIVLSPYFMQPRMYWYIYMMPPQTSSYDVIENELELIDNVTDFSALGEYNTYLSFDYVLSVSKPFPFRTNCFDYKQKNFESRAHAYSQCIKNRFLGNQTAVPSFIPITLADGNVTVIGDIHLEFYEHKKIRNILDYCAEIASRPDCVEEVYIARLLRPSSIGPCLSISAPGTPQIITVAKAKIELIDFITYCSSVLSFWFAFSPLMFLTESAVYKAIVNTLIPH